MALGRRFCCHRPRYTKNPLNFFFFFFFLFFPFFFSFSFSFSSSSYSIFSFLSLYSPLFLQSKSSLSSFYSFLFSPKYVSGYFLFPPISFSLLFHFALICRPSSPFSSPLSLFSSSLPFLSSPSPPSSLPELPERRIYCPFSPSPLFFPPPLLPLSPSLGPFSFPSLPLSITHVLCFSRVSSSSSQSAVAFLYLPSTSGGALVPVVPERMLGNQNVCLWCRFSITLVFSPLRSDTLYRSSILTCPRLLYYLVYLS